MQRDGVKLFEKRPLQTKVILLGKTRCVEVATDSKSHVLGSWWLQSGTREVFISDDLTVRYWYVGRYGYREMHKQAVTLPGHLLDVRAAEHIGCRTMHSSIAEVSFLAQQNICTLFILLLISLVNKHTYEEGKSPICTTRSSPAQPGASCIFWERMKAARWYLCFPKGFGEKIPHPHDAVGLSDLKFGNSYV